MFKWIKRIIRNSFRLIQLSSSIRIDEKLSRLSDFHRSNDKKSGYGISGQNHDQLGSRYGTDSQIRKVNN
jgi:hypothetical protein